MENLTIIQAEDVLEHTQVKISQQWLGVEYKTLVMHPYPSANYTVFAGDISKEPGEELTVNLNFTDLSKAIDMYNSIKLGERS